jgi:acetyltransferase-like isoleucine patch superfamily enzyme
VQITGKNSKVVIAPESRLWDVEIVVSGDNCNLSIGSCVTIREGGRIVLSNDCTRIVIGNRTTMTRPSISASEGGIIRFGEDCMIAKDSYITNGDGHPIFDSNGKRKNPAADVVIGNKVWLGIRSIVLKGVHIEDGAVIGAGTVLVKNADFASIYVGNPARKIAKDVHWEREVPSDPLTQEIATAGAHHELSVVH